jgi:hypothetical protein
VWKLAKIYLAKLCWEGEKNPETDEVLELFPHHV